MENKAVYVVGGAANHVREACLVALSEWAEPEGPEVKAALRLAAWSEVEFSRQIGVNDRTVRRWTAGERPIPYTAWCILAAQAGFGLIWQNSLEIKRGKE